MMESDHGPDWIDLGDFGESLIDKEMQRRFGADWDKREMSPREKASADDALRKLRQQADERYRNACKRFGIQPENPKNNGE